MRTIPKEESLDVEFKSDLKCYSDHDLIEEVVGMTNRDYTMLGAVKVLIDEEGMVISNPGGFIDGVNVKNLLTVEPHGRNPVLADAMKRIGFAG